MALTLHLALSALVVLSILVVWERSIVRALVFLAAASLAVTVVAALLMAPDVALTLAVTGTGLSTVMYLIVLKRLDLLKREAGP